MATIKPRDYLIGRDWDDRWAAFDVSALPPERADAILVQWVMGRFFRKALAESNWKNWTDFMAANPVARHRLYAFLDGSRIGRFEVVAAMYLAFGVELLPTPKEIQKAVEELKDHSEKVQREKARRKGPGRRR